MTQPGVRGNMRGHFPGPDSNHWVIVVHYGNLGDYNYRKINVHKYNKSESHYRGERKQSFCK